MIPAVSPLVGRLREIVGPENLLTAKSELMVYECDGFTIEKQQPEVVVFPTSTEHIVQIVKLCNELNLPFLARAREQASPEDACRSAAE